MKLHFHIRWTIIDIHMATSNNSPSKIIFHSIKSLLELRSRVESSREAELRKCHQFLSVEIVADIGTLGRGPTCRENLFLAIGYPKSNQSPNS
jgi:hypothetical protein